MRFHLLLTTFVLLFTTLASAAPNVRCEAVALSAQHAVIGTTPELPTTAIDITPKEEPARLNLDAKDLAIIEARKGWLDHFVERFKAPSAELSLTGSEEKIAFLNKNQAFRRFFKVRDSIGRDLEERNDPFDAQVKFVENQEDGLQAKIEMIRQAKHTIDLTYFIFADDTAGLSILHELKDAVRRGVRVRLMVDSLGSLKGSIKGDEHFKALLQEAAKNAGFMTDENGNATKLKATVEVVIFNPITNLLSRGANRRSHDKILLTDAMYPTLAMGMLGGRNVDDNYFTSVNGAGHPMLDYEIIVRNALGSDIAHEKDIGKVLNDYFERLYFHAANYRVARDLMAPLWPEEQLNRMAAASQTIAEKNADSKFSLKEGFYSEQMEFVHTIQNIMRKRILRNMGRPDRMQAPVNGSSLTRRMRELFLKSSEIEARTGKAERATLVSPYLVMSPNEMKLLVKWLAENRARKLTIITSSIATNNHLMAQAMVDDGLAKLVEMTKAKGLDTQLDINCYGRLDDKAFGGDRNYGTLHEKSFALEQARVSSVITYNGDPRSELLNSESGMILYGEESSNQRARHFEDLIAMSHKYDSPEWHELRSRMTGPAAHLVKFQSQFYQALRLFRLWYMI